MKAKALLEFAYECTLCKQFISSDRQRPLNMIVIDGYSLWPNYHQLVTPEIENSYQHRAGGSFGYAKSRGKRAGDGNTSRARVSKRNGETSSAPEGTTSRARAPAPHRIVPQGQSCRTRMSDPHGLKIRPLHLDNPCGNFYNCPVEEKGISVRVGAWASALACWRSSAGRASDL